MRKLAAFGTEMGRSSRNPIVKEGSRRKQGQIVVVALEVGELNVLAVVVRVMGSLMRNFLAFHRLYMLAMRVARAAGFETGLGGTPLSRTPSCASHVVSSVSRL